jgi:hypothetical protein
MMCWAGLHCAEVPPTVFKHKLAQEFPTLQLNGWKVGHSLVSTTSPSQSMRGWRFARNRSASAQL